MGSGPVAAFNGDELSRLVQEPEDGKHSTLALSRAADRGQLRDDVVRKCEISGGEIFAQVT